MRATVVVRTQGKHVRLVIWPIFSERDHMVRFQVDGAGYSLEAQLATPLAVPCGTLQDPFADCGSAISNCDHGFA
jgi:hypothetical protein